MITTRSTYGYIGGSDANRLFGSFDTPTFSSWWDERLTGIRFNSFSTLDTAVGNIMEARILDEVGVERKHRSVKKEKDGTMAGINTDALDSVCYHEVKTALVEDVYDWIIGKAIPTEKRRQILHGMYVTDVREARIHVLGMTREEKRNPYLVDLTGRVKTFIFGEDGLVRGHGFNIQCKNPKPFDFEDYDRRVRYLTACFERKVRPSDDNFKKFLNHFL